MAGGVASGASGGIITVVFFSAWGPLFGQAQLGRIQGVAQMLTELALAAAPRLMAEWHARTASYAGLLYVLAAMVRVTSVAILCTPLPAILPERTADYSLPTEPAIAGN